MIKAVAATGLLGTGFKQRTLAKAAIGASFIGCDAGSSDPGPYYLGSGTSLTSDSAVARDLELIITEGLAHNIPVLIGSAGTAGARPHLERTVQIVRSLAVPCPQARTAIVQCFENDLSVVIFFELDLHQAEALA